MIRRIAGSYEVDQHLREDLWQEIVLAIWQALPKFRGDASIKTFIARIAHNRSISHVAREVKRNRQALLDENIADDSPTPEEASDKNARRRALERIVRTLPIPQREIITLALEGFNHAEIADTFGISVNNATVRYHRAKAALMERIQKTHD